MNFLSFSENAEMLCLFETFIHFGVLFDVFDLLDENFEFHFHLAEHFYRTRVNLSLTNTVVVEHVVYIRDLFFELHEQIVFVFFNYLQSF